MILPAQNLWSIFFSLHFKATSDLAVQNDNYCNFLNGLKVLFRSVLGLGIRSFQSQILYSIMVVHSEVKSYHCFPPVLYMRTDGFHLRSDDLHYCSLAEGKLN